MRFFPRSRKTRIVNKLCLALLLASLSDGLINVGACAHGAGGSGSGGASGGGAVQKLPPQSVLLTQEDLDLLNRALTAASKIAEKTHDTDRESTKRLETDIRNILGRLAKKGYQGDPIYQQKIREIESALSKLPSS
jgi:hypothetical protein